MMGIETLIKRLNQYSQSLIAYKLGTDFADACMDAAAAIATLQAENKRLNKIVCSIPTTPDSGRTVSQYDKEMSMCAYLDDLEAENEKLRAEVESLKKEHCAGCSVPVVEAERLRDLNEAPKLRAELEQVTMERNAAVKDLEDLMADTEDSVCWLCAKADSTEPCRGAKGTCTPKWRGIQTDSSPYLVADEATEFNRDQWDWLLGRFTRKED